MLGAAQRASPDTNVLLASEALEVRTMRGSPTPWWLGMRRWCVVVDQRERRGLAERTCRPDAPSTSQSLHR